MNTIENIENTIESFKKEFKQLAIEKTKDYPIIVIMAIDDRISTLSTKINNCINEINRLKKKLSKIR